MVVDRSLEVVPPGAGVGQSETLPARVVCFGEVLLRLSAPRSQLLLQREVLETFLGGAEANVAVNLAGFGHEVQLVSALPQNAIGTAARRTIAGHGVGLVDAADAGDIGGRMGLYFFQQGAMTRSAQVIYDRAESSFARLDPAHLDWSELLEGADMLFASGITAALGEGPLVAMGEAFSEARKAGVKIAFDTNYRPALWQGREADAKVILRELSLQSDILFAGRRATAMMLGGDYSQHDAPEGFAAAAQAWFAKSDTVQHVAATRREVHSSDNQSLTAMLVDRQGVYVANTIELANIIDRIGTGDAFATGVLHGLLTGLPCDATVGFASACAQWAHSVEGDFMIGSISDVQSIGSSSSDVRR